ncbi:MAG: hypothetical protein J6D54_07920, partial [Olsenella sp.]|nr:hypothetical protein [Olsenella sp.]
MRPTDERLAARGLVPGGVAVSRHAEASPQIPGLRTRAVAAVGSLILALSIGAVAPRIAYADGTSPSEGLGSTFASEQIVTESNDLYAVVDGSENVGTVPAADPSAVFGDSAEGSSGFTNEENSGDSNGKDTHTSLLDASTDSDDSKNDQLDTGNEENGPSSDEQKGASGDALGGEAGESTEKPSDKTNDASAADAAGGNTSSAENTSGNASGTDGGAGTGGQDSPDAVHATEDGRYTGTGDTANLAVSTDSSVTSVSSSVNAAGAAAAVTSAGLSDSSSVTTSAHMLSARPTLSAQASTKRTFSDNAGISWTWNSQTRTIRVTASATSSSVSGLQFTELTAAQLPWLMLTGFDAIGKTDIERIEFANGANKVAPLSMAGWFAGYTNLKYFSGSGLDVSHVTSFASLFDGDAKLAEIVGMDAWNQDVSGSTGYGAATDYSNAFRGCSTVTTLNLSGFKTANGNIYVYTY